MKRKANTTPRRGPETVRCPTPFGRYKKPSSRRVHDWPHNINLGTLRPKPKYEPVWRPDIETEILLMMTDEECERKYGFLETVLK